MLRTLLVLGLLVLVAMLAHPIMVSAQHIGARVLQAESREIPNLPHTLERRLPPSHATPPIDMTSDSEIHLRTVVDESLHALVIMNLNGPQGPTSFELWNHNANRAIKAAQELVKRRAARWPQARLVTVRVTILKEYLEFIIHLDHVITKEDIHGAVVRVQTLHDMDTRERRVHWGRVLQVFGRLTVDPSPGHEQHNFRLVKLSLALIKQREAMDVFMTPPETLDLIDRAFQKWDDYSSGAIHDWRVIVTGGDDHDTAADWAQFLALQEGFLVQYFRLLIKYRSYNPVTDEDKEVAVERAHELLEMDRKRMLHWEQVLKLIQELRVGKVGLPIFLRVLNLLESI